MKSLLKALTNKWVIGIIGLLALSAFIWLAGGFIKFGENNVSVSPTARLVAIAFCWIIWLVWRLACAFFEKRQGEKLFGGIQKQQQEEDDAISVVDEKSQAETNELSDRFTDALKKLNHSRFGRSRSLYQLPWYILIGPPGSGKTTALVNSGLEFPLAESLGNHKLQGVGGTRNCDWWFTNDAILIDTAGRYTTQDSHKVVDQSAWTTFLQLLKKFRSRRPINGVVLTVNLQTLLVSTPEQNRLQAKTLRSRIDEIQTRLGIRAPVYVMLTKVDLVAGFAEFFSEMSKSERNQTWGMTFPLAEKEPTTLFRREYGLLIRRLNQQVLALVRGERILANRSRIQNFPQRMSEITETLGDFLDNAFAQNRYGTTPLLRGVYLSSGTQEGMPIDRMMAHMDNAFNLKAPAAAQANSGKSFFVYSLFKDVIFPESELVGTNPRVERMIRWGRRSAMAAMLILVAGSATIWTTAMGKTKGLLNQVEASIEQHQATQKDVNRTDVASVLTQLDPLREASIVYNESDQSYLTALGLYSNSVDANADTVYQQALNTILLPAFANELAVELESFNPDSPSLISTLKAYLMLFNAEKRDDEYLSTYAAAHVSIQQTLTEEQKSAWLAHFSQLLNEPIYDSAEPNERVIANARQKILQIPPALRLYAEIKDAPEFAQNVDLYRRIGGDTYLVFGISNQSAIFKMPMAFTKAGYEKLDLTMDSDLAKNYFGQQWIWGDEDATAALTEEEREAIGAELEKLYFADYASHWQTLLNSLNLAKASNISQFSDQLYLLSNAAQSPVKGLIELASENTRFSKYMDSAAPSSSGVKLGANGKPTVSVKNSVAAIKNKASDAWNSKQKINLVEKQFNEIHALTKKSERGPAPLEDYLQAIGELNEFLSAMSASPNPDEAAYAAVQKRFLGQSDSPITKLQLKAKYAPQPLRNWLNGLSATAWAMINDYGSRHINQIWGYQVLPDCRRLVENRFPFDASSSIDANPIAFNEFFAPGGTLDTFVMENLASYVDTARWRLKTVDGISAPLKQSTIQQIKRAYTIKRAFYTASDSAAAQFKVTPQKLDRKIRLFTLEVGGTPLTYSHGPRTPKPMEWSLGNSTRARILFEDLDEAIQQVQFDGDWAWYRLLATSESRPAGSKRARNITFTKNGHEAVYQFVSNTGEDPLDLTLFTRFACPASL